MAFEDVTPFIYSTAVTIIAVAGAMWRVIAWQNKRQEDRAGKLALAESEKARILREYADKLHREVVDSLKTMDAKMSGMVEDLRKRADLTNGNVSFIRADIADLQEDMLDLWDTAADGSPHTTFDRGKKMKALERRKRRRKIEADRIAQSER